MKQEQKDTIREEFESRWNQHEANLIADKGGVVDLRAVLEFMLNKLDKAYQDGYKAGAKDKVEEMEILLNKTKLPTNGEGNIRTLLYIPDEDYNRAVNKRIDWTIKSLKDNT